MNERPQGPRTRAPRFVIVLWVVLLILLALYVARGLLKTSWR